MSGDIVVKSDFSDLKLIKRGKVRDVYEVDGNLLIVASDRMSAFDVVMDDPIPDKGRILTAISIFWLEYQSKGSICGIILPKGLKESGRLPEPIFTPSTKAEGGEHDENISFES